MNIPKQPKIYHILHVDRLSSVINASYLWCDTKIREHNSLGTNIGMEHIKKRRLETVLTSYPDLHVGECVPFYFCPRSPMLYMLYRKNSPDITYCGGQDSILPLEADFYASIQWASQHKKRWVFTLSNAGSAYFEDRNDSTLLNELDWPAITAHDWSAANIKENKQVEFLMECSFSWDLIERVGVHSNTIQQQVKQVLSSCNHKPRIEIIPTWYY